MVVGDSAADHSHRVPLGFEAVPVDALLLQGADHALNHAILLRAVGVLNSWRRP